MPERLFARDDLERFQVRAPIYTEVIKSLQVERQMKQETLPVTIEKAAEWLGESHE